ncbi:MAG: formate/nitrite transporter family protein [Bacteroidetes bacterium]|nr:formate/nitrite transporter family protein [Bacteroidota bacterium]
MYRFRTTCVEESKREIVANQPLNSDDAFTPAEIAERIEKMGVTKARLSTLRLLLLALLAGAFISMGSLFFIVVTSESTLSFGMTRLIGGIAFSLGLILVVIAGAELFTGNNLVAMAWADRKITMRDLLRNWLLSYVGNVIGCLITVGLVWYAGIDKLNDGAIGKTAVGIAEAKVSLTFLQAFARGILCNALVCIAVWLVMGGHSVTDKILAVIFPITAFVTMGFEHSIANWFFLPYGFLTNPEHSLSISGSMQNLAASTAGNLVGGTVLVAGVYWLAYVRKA